MMIEPPIDKLVEQIGCKYALVCLVSSRTQFLLKNRPETVKNSGLSPVTYAATEVYKGKVKIIGEE